MDLFENLPWRISEPSVLDVGTNFLKEETVSQSYVFLDNYELSEPEEQSEDEPQHKKSENNTKKTNKKKNKILKGCNETSRLNKTEHQQCLQAMMLLDTGRPLSSLSLKEQQVINIYNSLKSLIHEENVEFLKFVETKWKQKVNKNTVFCSQLLHSFALAKRLQKIENVKKYPQFYASHKMVPLTKAQHEIETIHEACLLELGLIASIQIPDVEKNTSLYVNQLPPLKTVNLEDYLETTKQPVSEDIHAEFLANQTACNIVISSSSLKTIIDNFGPDFIASWDIPITVKEHEINGHKFNVVYVDKTLPQRNISMSDLSYNVRKVLMKRTMCKMFDFNSFMPPPRILENFNTKKYGNFNTETKDDIETIECNVQKKQKLNAKIESPLDQTNNDNKLNECEKQKTNSEIKSPIETQKRDINIETNEFERGNSNIETSLNQTNNDYNTNEYEKQESYSEIESPMETQSSYINTETNEFETDNSNIETSLNQTNDDYNTNKCEKQKIESPMETQTSDINIETNEFKKGNSNIETSLNQTNDNYNTNECEKQKLNHEIETNYNETKTNECRTPKRAKNNTEIKTPELIDVDIKRNEFKTPKNQNISQISSPSMILTRSASRILNQVCNTELSETESLTHSEQLITEDETESVADNEEKQNSKMRKKGQKNKPSSYHNVNYRLWKLKVKDQENVLMKNCAETKEIKVIVRSKIDAFQDGPNGQKLLTNIVPKLEFQPEHGGQVLTKSELLRQWTTLYFRPFSNLIRARVNIKNNKYVKIENINLNKITNECVKHNFIPKDSVGLLFNVLSKLTNLAPGKYLLHHTPKHGSFAALLKSNPENAGSDLNLHELYTNENCTIVNSTKWIPIDMKVILPNHVKNGLMPGMFPPQKVGKNNNKNKGKFKQKNQPENKRRRKDWDAPSNE